MEKYGEQYLQEDYLSVIISKKKSNEHSTCFFFFLDSIIALGDNKMIGVSLKKKKEMSMQCFASDLQPTDVYLPITNDDVIFVTTENQVHEGDVLGRYTKYDLPILASISGTVFIPENKTYIQIQNNGEIVEYKKEEIKKEYKKEELISLLKEAGICGMGGAGFPAYIKYSTEEKINTLIVNAVACEPYITSDYVCTLKYTNEILEAISILMHTFDIKECMIAIKAKSPLLKEKLLTRASEYPKIRVIEVPNLYPMGWEKSLVRYLKHMDYKKLPIEKGIVVSNISTIYAISEALFCQKPQIDRIVTFSGENMKNPCNVHVKIGTKISTILEKIGGVLPDSTLILGGPMMGRKLDLENDVILPVTTAVLALPSKAIEETSCIKCGKCTENCPSKISPILIYENRNNKKALQRLNPEACIECGICSYICPAKILVRNAVIEAKKIVKGEKK